MAMIRHFFDSAFLSILAGFIDSYSGDIDTEYSYSEEFQTIKRTFSVY